MSTSEFTASTSDCSEGGIWAIVDVEYMANEDGAPKEASPFRIAELRPIQLARFDFDELREAAQQFTTDEWIDVLLRSVGLEPTTFARRLKLLLLARLIPFVEHNYNFIELGPRGTGKSYVFSEFSPYCILISGGKASSANLFYNNARRKVGLVGFWDVVAFDEVGGMKVSDPDVMHDHEGLHGEWSIQPWSDAGHGRRVIGVRGESQSARRIVSCQHGHRPVPTAAERVRSGVDRPPALLSARLGSPKNSKDILTTRYGFVTDYLAEAFRHLAKENQTDTAERFFRFGSHVEGRDAQAVRRTVSGYLKLLHPDGTFDKEQVREYVELAMEARRRIKEQLKKRHFTEFHKTSFSYIDQETNHEVVVPVPEQSGTGAISQDPLPAGSVYAAAIDSEANVGLYRLEVTVLPGSGKMRTPATMERQLKESLQRAFAFLQSNQDKMGLSGTIAQKDLTVEAVELTGGKVEVTCGVAFFIAMMSAIHDRQVEPGMVVLGDLTIQGNIKGLTSILEPLQVAVDNGASRALVPISNKAQFAALPEDVVEKLELVFYSEPDRALRRALAS